MSTDATTNKPLRPAPVGQTNPPMPDAEEKLRAIAEAQGVVLDGKASERILAAGQGLGYSEEEFERFMAILREARKGP